MTHGRELHLVNAQRIARQIWGFCVVKCLSEISKEEVRPTLPEFGQQVYV